MALLIYKHPNKHDESAPMSKVFHAHLQLSKTDFQTNKQDKQGLAENECRNIHRKFEQLIGVF
jgi:hypothetical protein